MQTPSILAAPIPLISGTQVYRYSSTTFVKNIAACLIKTLHDYLKANIKQFPSLQALFPLLTRAVELYMEERYDQAITQSFQAYIFVETLGTSLPSL